MKKLLFTAAGLACVAMFGAAPAADLTGAGSSFVGPVISKWAEAYNQVNGSKVNYQPNGSSAGLTQVVAKTVDFGASDMPLKPEEQDAKGLVQFPVIVGGIVPIFRLDGVAPGTLHLTGQVLGDIYLGKITTWDDPAITALNPTIKLPSIPIVVVRRAEGSGTTFNFTNYLSKVNSEWKTKVGEGTTVNWPVGTGGKGSDGVTVYVQRLPGAIGYVEYAYAKQAKVPYALVQNAAGAYVEPEEASFQAAAANAEWEKNRYYVVLTNQPGKAAWPISAATFVLMQKTQDKPEQGTAVLKFFDWALNNGQKLAADLDYVPLPPTLVKSIEQSWQAQIKDPAGKALSVK